MGGHLGIVVGFKPHAPAFHLAAHIEIIGKLPVVHNCQFRIDIGDKGVGKIDIFHTFSCQANMPDAMGAVDRRNLVAFLQLFGRSLILVNLEFLPQGMNTYFGMAVDIPI